jgi:iron complex outermembrane receptor protein
MNQKKISKTIAIAMFLGCANYSNAQLNINGTITSSNKKPIPFSVIGVKGSFITTQSNLQGEYQLKNLKPGKYVLSTKCIGYKERIDTLSLNSDIKFDIALSEDDVALDEIIVNSTRVDANSGFAHTNISAEEIKKQNFGQDLPYALNNITSAVINSDAGNGVGYTGIRIRGTDGTRINVTVNGVPINDAESQGTFFVNMSDILSSTKSIQVQRGVGTSANGAGAFGASINMETNSLNELPYAEINNSFGSFNTIKNTIAAGTGLINKHFTFDARASRINSDGYIDRASSNLGSYYLSGAYYGKKTMVKALCFNGWEKTYQAWYYVPQDSLKAGNRTFNPAGMYYDSNGNLKYYNNETDNYRQDNYQLHAIHSFSEKLTINLTGHYTKGKGYYEQYKEDEKLSKYRMPDVIVDSNTTINRSDIIRRRWLDNDFIGVIGNVNYKASDKLNFVLGGGYNNYVGRHFGEVIWAQFANPDNLIPIYYDNKATKNDANVYLKTTYRPIEKLTIFADLQSRNISYDFVGFDTSVVYTQSLNAKFNFFNPKFGINYLLGTNTNVYASYGIANKEPNRNDFTESSRLSRPKHEKLMDLEIGATHRFKKASISVNLYDMQYENQLVLNGQINDVGAYSRVNVDFSYRRGIELELNSSINKYISINGNLTLSKNKIKNFTEYIDSSDVNYTVFTQYKKNYTETDISFSPNIIAAGNILFYPIKNLEIAILNKYVGKQYLDNTSDNERAINPYFVSDLRINYTIKTKLVKEINLMAIIYNIGNTVYETNGYNYSYYMDATLYKSNYLAPAAPRNFMLGLNLKF